MLGGEERVEGVQDSREQLSLPSTSAFV